MNEARSASERGAASSLRTMPRKMRRAQPASLNSAASFAIGAHAGWGAWGLASRRRAADLRGPKFIANPRLIRAIHNPHQFSMWGDEETHFCDDLRINHYWSRSIEELTEKLRRGDAW